MLHAVCCHYNHWFLLQPATVNEQLIEILLHLLGTPGTSNTTCSSIVLQARVRLREVIDHPITFDIAFEFRSLEKLDVSIDLARHAVR